MSEKIKITCSVETIRFYKNQFGIILASVDRVKEGSVKKGELLTLKGVMPEPKIGNIYNITAEEVDDPKWGKQYDIKTMFTAIVFDDNDKNGQKKFLASLFTPLQVTNMYDALENPFEVLKKNDAKELIKVKGCGLDTADRWIRKFNQNLYLGKIFTELDEYNLTNTMINKLIDRYTSPDLVISKVKENPYILCNEVNGVGWKTADKIALNGGMEPYCTKRIGAYMLHYLNTVGESGSSWITPDELMGAILEELGDDVPDEKITETIYELEERLWWNEDKSKIGLRRYYNIEEKVAKELIRLRDADSSITYDNWMNSVKHLEHKQGWQYTDEQIGGVKTVLSNNVVVITGGAGVGKTSLVSAMLEVLRNYSYVQCSLSGRAASRMSEVTGQEGYTIHRLLGFPYGEPEHGGFTFHEDNQMCHDIYIVDEISMIDAFLFYNLIRAIPNGAKLVMLGDPSQLEAIGCGNVAYDMIHSGEIPVVTLTKIHRQAAKSGIITESVRVRNGQQIIEKDWVGEESRGELKDLDIKCFSDGSNTYYEIMKYFAHALKDSSNILQTQILVPVKNRGAACTYELNNAAQEMYNPESKKKQEHTAFTAGKPYILREGDKVINTANNYKTTPPIFNGNIGIIKSIGVNEADDEIMTIDFQGIGEVEVPREAWNEIELGYAITVHKAQGSEFDIVILGIDFSAYSLLTRELLYTGITRAKSKCKLLAQTGALRMAVSREGVSKKQTHLQQCLYDVAHPKLIF